MCWFDFRLSAVQERSELEPGLGKGLWVEDGALDVPFFSSRMYKLRRLLVAENIMDIRIGVTSFDFTIAAQRYGGCDLPGCWLLTDVLFVCS